MHAYTSTGWSIADWEILLSIWTSWLPLGVGWTIILPILVGHVLLSEQVMAKPLKSNTNTRKQKGNNDKVLSYSISILELTIMNHPQPSTPPPPPLVVCISQPWHVEPDSSWQSNHILNMAGFTERDRFAIINWWSVWRCSTNAKKPNTMLPCESRRVFVVHTSKVASQLSKATWIVIDSIA